MIKSIILSVFLQTFLWSSKVFSLRDCTPCYFDLFELDGFFGRKTFTPQKSAQFKSILELSQDPFLLLFLLYSQYSSFDWSYPLTYKSLLECFEPLIETLLVIMKIINESVSKQLNSSLISAK